MPTRSMLALLLILALGAGLRAAYLLELREAPDLAHPGLDAGYHDYWARGLAFGTWAPPPDQMDPEIGRHPFFRPPGYPYFLALVYGLTGAQPLATRLLQSALGLLAIALAFAFMRRRFGDAPALLTALLSAVYWVFIYYEGELLEPPLLLALLWGLLYALAAWQEQPTARRAALAGLLLGLFTLTRPNGLLLLPVVALWMLWMHRAAARATLRQAALFAAAAALCILTATARNAIVARDFVLISSNGGINLLLGQDAEAVANHASVATGNWNCFDYPRLMAQASAEAGHPLKASEISARYAREARQQMAERPGLTLRLLALKTLLFWGPREVSNNKVEELERAHSRILRALPVSFSFLASWGLLGFFLAWRRERGRPEARALLALMGLLALVYFASFLPFIAAGQYRVPVIPLLIAFAALGGCALAALLRARRWREAALALAAGFLLWGLLAWNPTGYRVQPMRWHLARAIAAERAGRLPQAEEEYRAALALAPELELLPLRLGALLARQERVTEALPLFRRALELAPENPDARFNLALALALTGQPAEAIPHFEAVLQQQPRRAEAHQNLANAYQLTGQPDKALHHRRLALPADP